MRKSEAAQDTGATGERYWRGLGVSPGIAIGPAYVLESGMGAVPERRLERDEIPGELARFAAAVAKARKQVLKLKGKAAALPGDAADEIGMLLDAHVAILSGSRLIRGVERRIADQASNAECAVQAEISQLARHFAAMQDAYLAGRIQDIREVGQRLIRALTDQSHQSFSGLPPGTILLAEEITPADTALMNPALIGGFAASLGGAEGHTAIMARSLGLPAVLGLAQPVAAIRRGSLVIVDGLSGTVIADPGDATLAEYRCRQQALAADREQLKTLIDLPAESRDGLAVALEVNLELPQDVAAARQVAASGIGLVRSEFLFMNRDDLPGEDEQYRTYRDIVTAMAGRPVTIRTLDVGGEKLATALGDRFGVSANPALGLRAVRLSLREPHLLDTQLAAMLRAGAHGPVRMLLPMVTGADQVRQVRRAMVRLYHRLKRAGVTVGETPPPLGVMIEVPAAALTADALAAEADFFALGTNDLIQYTLAIDRSDDQVADLYDPLHPAVLRLIQLTVDAADRHTIPVSVCGEMAGDPRYTALLIGLGLRTLSMSPGALLPVKRRLRLLDSQAATDRARLVMSLGDPGRISSLIDDFNEAA